MYPREHIVLGAGFAFIVYLLFDVSVVSAFAIFLASFLIDFDHYISACVVKKRFLSYNEAYVFQDSNGKRLMKLARKGILLKEPFNVFHTVEFHLLILFLGWFVSPIFYFIFFGMIFHVFLDLIEMRQQGMLHAREWWFVKGLINLY